eukprot:GHVU01129753.1.p1 GENE.GHVU01129753.1~~GHVU01129753.1.p1  ORF type:complete len:447 (+),score=86.45 GHVU01129753.1:1123-2463(+)
MMLATRALVGGGGGGAAVIGSAAACATCAALCIAYRKKIPHPTEYDCMGKPAMWCGCHTHEKFTLVIEVHEGKNAPKNSSVYLHVSCGRFESQINAIEPDKDGALPWYETTRIHVRQRDDEVLIKCYKKGLLQDESVGELRLDVHKDLITPDFPVRQWYTLQHEGKNSVKVQLSFRKIAADLPEGSSPLLEQAIIMAQLEAEATGKKANLDFSRMDDLEKLVFFSKVLEGPLMLLREVGGWHLRYYKAEEKRANHWQWSYWSTKEACQMGKKPEGGVKFMGISHVLPDRDNRHQFFVKYHDNTGTRNMFFKRVDRDRDVWCDGLYEFVNKLRNYLEKHPAQTKPEAHLQKFHEDDNPEKKKKKKDKKSSASRRRSFAQSPSGSAVSGADPNAPVRRRVSVANAPDKPLILFPEPKSVKSTVDKMIADAGMPAVGVQPPTGTPPAGQ